MRKKLRESLLTCLLIFLTGSLACIAGSSTKTVENSGLIADTGTLNYHFSRDWLKRTNIYVFGQPPLEYLEAVKATGVTWSVYWVGLNKEDLKYAEDLHRHGFKVGSNLPTIQGHIDLVGGDRALLENGSCRDLKGNISYLTWVPEAQVYFMCHNNPEWQNFLVKRIKENIDGYADAIQIDETAGNGSRLDVAGFCEYCMAGFRNYLIAHYSEAELRERFGINDMESFDYRSYLLEHNAGDVWQDPNPDLSKEYVMFQYTSRYNQLKNLIESARQYGGSNILLSANLYGMEPNQQIFLPLVDFVVFEMATGTLPAGKHSIEYLLGEAMDSSKTYTGFPDIFELAALSPDDWWLWRHWLAEAFASGGSFLLPYKAYTYGGGEFTLPANKIVPYTDFLASNKKYYEGSFRLANVGLFYSLDSTLFNNIAWQDFIRTARILEEAHIPFKVLYKGDGQFVEKMINLNELSQYQIIIVPPGHKFDIITASIIKQYQDRGGQIIRLEAVPDNIQILEALQKTGVDPGTETTASANLSVKVYQREGTLIVHFVNYNYDYGYHDFIPEPPFEISITIPENMSKSGKILKLISPEQPSKILDYTLQGNRINFTVPSIHEYSIAIFE